VRNTRGEEVKREKVRLRQLYKDVDSIKSIGENWDIREWSVIRQHRDNLIPEARSMMEQELLRREIDNVPKVSHKRL
jgi:hypothetical protein